MENLFGIVSLSLGYHCVNTMGNIKLFEFRLFRLDSINTMVDIKFHTEAAMLLQTLGS